MFEQVVRPFQTPATINDKETIVTTVIRAPSQRALITWGAAGTKPTPTGGLSFKVKNFNEYSELSRETTDVRIENPDDSSQYVIAQRIDSITFKKKLKVPETAASGASGGASDNTGTTSGNYNNDTETPATTDSTVSSTSDVPAGDTTADTTTSTPKTENDKFTLTQPKT